MSNQLHGKKFEDHIKSAFCGTTGIACKNLHRTFVGIEMVDEYFEIAKARIENYK